jgi:hypothetical protein
LCGESNSEQTDKGRRKTASGDTNSLTRSPVFFSNHTHTYIQQQQQQQHQQQQQTSKLMTAEVLIVDEKDTSIL